MEVEGSVNAAKGFKAQGALDSCCTCLMCFTISAASFDSALMLHETLWVVPLRQ